MSAPNWEVYLLFVDFKNVYDNITLAKLSEALQRTNLNTNFIIQENYHKVKCENQISNGFTPNTGLKVYLRYISNKH